MAAKPAASEQVAGNSSAGLAIAESPECLRAFLATDDTLERWAQAAGLADHDTVRRIVRGWADGRLSPDLLGELIESLGRLLPDVVDADRVLITLDRFLGTLHSPLSAVALFQRDPSALKTLLAIVATSPYLAEIVLAEPDTWEQIRRGGGRPEKRESLRDVLRADIGNQTDPRLVMRALRRFKRREVLRIAYGDIVMDQRLETVVGQISAVADCVVAEAVRVAWLRQLQLRGEPLEADGTPATLTVLALGKLGGNELNYSSDIDLIFCFSAEGRVAGPKPCTNGEFFQRVVQEATKLISEQTELGSAYRVDLRLRPHGNQGPLVLPLAAVTQYYDRQGRTWERQAWVKARCIAGDQALGARLLASLEPWVYSRWLNRTDISGIRALKRRIEQRAVREGADEADLKTGRGGIRDIEFTIQFLQLLNGGDTPDIRGGNTIEAIRRLTASGGLTDQEREILERTYRLLRTVEHRLQILYDRQTHRLPDDDAEFVRLAVRTGYGNGPAAAARLRADLAEATRLNRRILDHLLHDAFPGEKKPEPEVDLILDPDPAAETVAAVLAPYRFRNVPQASRLLMSLGEEPVRFLSSRRCRHFLAAIAARLLNRIAATPDPDATLNTLAAVSDSLGGKAMLWEMLSESPATLDLTIRFCSATPFLADLLVRNPGMIDELQDSLLGGEQPTREELERQLWMLCGPAVDILPSAIAFKVAQQLRIGIRGLHGELTPHATAAALTDVAEAVLRVVVTSKRAELVDRLGPPQVAAEPAADAGMVVLAMGKFGGQEMNYASDVDVVFLYNHDGTTRPPAADKPGTTNSHFFGELANRCLQLFNTFTPQGRLYEVDSRLRPSGRNSPLAISLDAFDRYFATDGPAAVWERQALIKARVVIGSVEAAGRVTETIHAASYGFGWTRTAVEEIRAMRLRMEEGAATSNLKRGPGGVVDIEFAVQLLQLLHGGRLPAVRTPNTLAGLEALAAADLIETATADSLRNAYDLLRSIECSLRLLDVRLGHDFPASAEARDRLAALLGRPSGSDLAAEVADTTAHIRQIFHQVFDAAAATAAEPAGG
jgi:glutamate-ammonia-ligase adenylyltransferase